MFFHKPAVVNENFFNAVIVQGCQQLLAPRVEVCIDDVELGHAFLVELALVFQPGQHVLRDRLVFPRCRGQVLHFFDGCDEAPGDGLSRRLHQRTDFLDDG